MSAPEFSDTLAVLAALAGIEPFYHDIWGAPHPLSDDTRRTFLAAMGLPAADAEQTGRSLKELAARPWRRALEPVTTLDEDGDDAAVALVIAAGAAGTVRWRLTAEDGSECAGEARCGDLSVADTFDLEDGKRERRRLPLPGTRTAGYYRLEVEGTALAEGVAAASVIVAPARAYVPPRMAEGAGVWGIAVQLYGLKGRNGWGMGDFGSLRGFAPGATALGAQAVGINPLHALFRGNPAHASPYSPSSRRFLNPLYIDVTAVPDLEECAAAREMIGAAPFQQTLSRLRGEALIDYPGVAAAKLPILERLFRSFRDHHLKPATARGRAFIAFVRGRGAALARHATFEALAEFIADGRTGHFPWREWPAPYRDPASAGTAAFARDHAERIAFHQYLQWEADRQLAAAATACTGAGMRVGLYRDLALGVDADGADVWAAPHLFAEGIAMGAPPDPFNLQGQNWGLIPYNPHALRDAAYGPFIAALRANMRHAGALRIDHVMAMTRLFWLPRGASATEGGYVRYPLDDMLAITALESQRARCAVIGEDLGTVPEGLRERLAAKSIQSIRLLYFERWDDGSFRPAEAYPAQAQVAVGTHDLPPFPGYWHERDIDLRAALHLMPAPDSEANLRRDRARARDALATLLLDHGLLAAAMDGRDDGMAALVAAVYRFLASTPARLLMVQIEDVLGLREQANLPGTVDIHPNWRRVLPLAWEDVLADPRLRGLAAELARLRPP